MKIVVVIKVWGRKGSGNVDGAAEVDKVRQNTGGKPPSDGTPKIQSVLEVSVNVPRYKVSLQRPLYVQQKSSV